VNRIDLISTASYHPAIHQIQRGRSPYRILIWEGLLLVLAGLAAWGGWSLFDKFYRQPRFAEMQCLHAECTKYMKRAAYAKSLMSEDIQNAQRDIAIVEQFLQMPNFGLTYEESLEIRRQAVADHKKWAERFMRDARAEDNYWTSVFNENIQAAAKLDQRSLQCFGVPAAQLLARIAK
jgi:hypothetical protein